jgi:segregation and condensation protein B
MSIKAKLEALIYAAEEPITLDQMAALLKEDLLAQKEQVETATPAPDGPQHAEEHLGAIENGVAPPAIRPIEKSKADDAGKTAKAKHSDKSEKAELRALLKPWVEELAAEYARDDRGIEIRQVAGGYRMSTKPEHHDVVRAFSKSLKPPIRLSLQALETLAVIAYKQPVTVPEISDIRGVDASAVIGTLLERKLVTTAGRKAVVGRPMLYKTTKDFLLRFGLKDITELPSLEEFEKLAAGELQEEMFAQDTAIADATGVPDAANSEAAGPEETQEKETPEKETQEPGEDENGGIEQMAEDKAAAPENVTEPTVSSDPRHTQADEEVAGEVAQESTGG